MNWRRFFERDRADAEQREELEFYIETTAEEYIARGMDPTEARVAARKKLGNPTLIREEVFRMNTLTFAESILRDALHALRMIGTKPAFSVPALLSLALGIGANIAIFTVVDRVLIRPLPYPDPEALVGVFNSANLQGQSFNDVPLSPSIFAAYKAHAQALQEFGIWTAGAATVSGIGEPEQVAMVTMSQGVLPTLAVPPFLGRWFSNDDDVQGSPETVILSYGYWQRRFGGDERILGQTVLIDFVPRQVIGVMPRSFQFLDLSPDLFLPKRLPKIPNASGEFNHSGIARLKPGVTLAQANQDITRVLGIWTSEDGEGSRVRQLQIRSQIRPLKQDVVGGIGAVLGILMGALVLVLLLVCANVANLVQVRAQARQQEFAIRAALGAGWGRIARGLLIESLTSGILGGAMGLGLAYVGLRLLVARGSAIPRLDEISIDSTSLLFALGCSLGTSVLFGLIGILKSGRSGRIEHVRGSSAGRQQLRAQNALVVAQVGLALVLLIAAGLMVRSFVALQAVTPGFTHPKQIQTVRILIPEAQVREPARIAQIHADILERLAAIPGVTAAGSTSALPMEAEYHNGNSVAVEGKTPLDQIPPNRTTKRISPGLFAAQGTRLIAGRDFAWTDVFGQRLVAIVSENMARENWGDPRNAMGKRIKFGGDGPWMVVIGVAEEVHEDGPDRRAPETVYLPGPRRSVALEIRSSRAGTESFVQEVAAAIHGVNANLPLAKVRTLKDVYRQSMARTSFALVLLGIAGAMSLILSIVGVYGVLAYAVAQRRKEVSIRIALGAEAAMVKILFVRQGLILACAGGVIGLFSAAALSRLISSLLFEVTPLDPITYAVSGAIILAAALAASYIPARRAAAVDPMEALRGD